MDTLIYYVPTLTRYLLTVDRCQFHSTAALLSSRLKECFSYGASGGAMVDDRTGHNYCTISEHLLIDSATGALRTRNTCLDNEKSLFLHASDWHKKCTEKT
jgi:hypothetical protein